MMKLCPTCHRDLQEDERLSMMVDLCPKCRGIWLAEGKLERIVEYILAMHAPAGPSNLLPRLTKVYETSVRRATDKTDAPQ